MKVLAALALILASASASKLHAGSKVNVGTTAKAHTKAKGEVTIDSDDCEKVEGLSVNGDFYGTVMLCDINLWL